MKDNDNEVDEFVREVFDYMKVPKPTPSGIRKLYWRVKALTDTIRPQRLDAQTLALIVALAETKSDKGRA